MRYINVRHALTLHTKQVISFLIFLTPHRNTVNLILKMWKWLDQIARVVFQGFDIFINAFLEDSFGIKFTILIFWIYCKTKKYINRSLYILILKLIFIKYIVYYLRYINVCHAVYAYRKGEKKMVSFLLQVRGCS